MSDGVKAVLAEAKIRVGDLRLKLLSIQGDKEKVVDDGKWKGLEELQKELKTLEDGILDVAMKFGGK